MFILILNKIWLILGVYLKEWRCLFILNCIYCKRGLYFWLYILGLKYKYLNVYINCMNIYLIYI